MEQEHFKRFHRICFNEIKQKHMTKEKEKKKKSRDPDLNQRPRDYSSMKQNKNT